MPFLRSAVLAALVLIPALPASATVYLPADFNGMTAASAFVVHGVVADVRSEPLPDRSAISTYVTVSVAQALKGTPGESITFRVPGGQVGRYRRIVVGAPQFERGDEVVVFLASRGPSIPYVFGLSQGVYRVSRDRGTPLVTPLLAAREGTGGEGAIVRGDPARRPLPLERFAQEVRAAVERAR